MILRGIMLAALPLLEVCNRPVVAPTLALLEGALILRGERELSAVGRSGAQRQRMRLHVSR